MFKVIRTADTKITQVYDMANKDSLNSFKNRFAHLIDSSKEETAARLSTAVESGYLYCVVSALHGNHPCNQNGDFFLWTELLKKKKNGVYTFQTWINKPVLENHNPKAVRGEILDAWPIKGEKSIDMLHRVDEKINPNLIKGIRNGSILGTSMGVMVSRSYCSICDNLAYVEDSWCEHLHPSKLNIKGKKYTGQDGNLYPDKIGTICYEDNRDLEGVEDSFITLGEPADPKALTKSVLA